MLENTASPVIQCQSRTSFHVLAIQNEEEAAQRLNPLGLSVECSHPEVKNQTFATAHFVEMISTIVAKVKLKNHVEQYEAQSKEKQLEHKNIQIVPKSS